jgi:hypothetical protein
VGDHHRAGLREDPVQVFNDFRLFGFFHFALLTSAHGTIRAPTLLHQMLPQGPNPKCGSFLPNPVSFPVCAGEF